MHSNFPKQIVKGIPWMKAVNLQRNRPYTHSLYTSVPIDVGIHNTVTAKSASARFTRKYKLAFLALSADTDTMISMLPTRPITNVGTYRESNTTVEKLSTVYRFFSN